MNEFAHVLSEIIDQGKKEKKFNIQKLAQHAGITASYLSNMKQANRKPPAHKTLLKLADAMRNFGVPEADIQQMLEAYSRTQLGAYKETNLLSLLIDTYHEEGGFLERLQKQIQPKAKLPKFKTLENGIIEGDLNTFMSQATRLFQRGFEVNSGDNMYITWFYCPSEEELNTTLHNALQQLLNTVKSFLGADSSFKLLVLCSCEVSADLMLIQRFLGNFIGTSNCFLYEVPGGPHLPQYFVFEGIGFVEAVPKSADQFWIRTVLIDEEKKTHPNELNVLVDYLEYLLDVKERQPVLQTMASLEEFAITRGLEQLLEAEQQSVDEERLVIKNFFSTVYWPSDDIRTWLQTLNVPRNSIDVYVEYHRKKSEVFDKRLERGKERALHSKGTLRQKLAVCLKGASSKDKNQQTVFKSEVELLKSQILYVLKTITQNSRFRFALTDQDMPITFILIGDVAFFGFDLLQREKDQLRIEEHQLETLAWTSHPEVIYYLQREFDEKWKEVDPKWRSDNEEGKRHIIDFIVAESIKAFLQVNVSPHELWSFMKALVETAGYLDMESFFRELYLQEQVAKDIFLVEESCPILTMPVTIGPWDPRSAVRTRQRLFSPILRELNSFHVVSTQTGLEQYWNTDHYRHQNFESAWTTQHFRYFHDLLLEASEKIAIEIVPSPEEFPINFEIIDNEWVFIENVSAEDIVGGLVLHDKDLAKKLIKYIGKNLLPECPEQLKGTTNVAKWFKEKFGREG